MTAPATASGSRSVSARRAGGVRTSSYAPSDSPAKAADRVDAAHHVTAGVGGVGLADVRQCFWIAEHRERLFELGEVVRADDHRRITAIARDDDAFVLVLDAIDDLGEVVSYSA